MARSVFSSSSLLTEITQRPLDPGYAAAARRRARDAGSPAPTPATAVDGEPGTPPPADPATRASASAASGDAARARRRRRGLTWTTVVIGVVLGVVAGAGVAQLRAGPLGAQDRAVLVAEVERRTALADDLADANADLREEIETIQAEAIGEGASSLLEDTERLAVVTGAVRVQGDGVVVVLDDAPEDPVGAVDGNGQITDDGRVRDVDVQTVVNGLWAAGAEGIAVNGQRLTSLSTIRHAGDAIVVDLRQLARPYTITAVGDPETLEEEARTGQAGQWAAFLRDSYGIEVSVEAAEDLELPPASRLALRHARGADGTEQEPTSPVGQEEAGQS